MSLDPFSKRAYAGQSIDRERTGESGTIVVTRVPILSERRALRVTERDLEQREVAAGFVESVQRAPVAESAMRRGLTLARRSRTVAGASAS